MKKSFYLLGVIILILSFVFIGCGDDDDNNNNNNNVVDIPSMLRGTYNWECDDCSYDHTATLTLNENTLVFSQPSYGDKDSVSDTYTFSNIDSFYNGSNTVFSLTVNQNSPTSLKGSGTTISLVPETSFGGEESIRSTYFSNYHDCRDASILPTQIFIKQN